MSPGPLWRLAPWSRAPRLALSAPAAVLAGVVTVAVLACALASAPLFLSSARSAALQAQLAPQCAEAGWQRTAVTVRLPAGTAPGTVAAAVDAQRSTWERLGRDSRRALLITSSVGSGGNAQAGVLVRDPAGVPLTQPATLLWQAGVTRHVQVVDGSTAAGVWLPASYAEAAGAAVGDRVTVAGVPVAVAGVYTDLFDTDAGPYWCDHRSLYLNPGSANTPPPALLLASDEQTARVLARGAGFVTVAESVPAAAADLSAGEARELVDQQRAAAAAVRLPDGVGLSWSGWNDRLDDAVARAGTIEAGLRGPVVAVAVAGGLLALALVAAAGSFWADRRAAEVRLLAARGVGPGPLAGKAALELALPALLGAGAGGAAARLLVAGLGPADDLDPAAVRLAGAAGVGALAAGLLTAALVAGLRVRAGAERGTAGARPRRAAAAPWELALLLAAAGCWLLLRTRDPVVVDAGVAQVNGLLVAFPLLAVAGAAVLAARLATRALPALRRWAAGRRPAGYLAVHRLAAAPLAAGTLLVAVALPVAVLGYTATLTAGSQATLEAKVGVQVGAGRALVSIRQVVPDAGTDAVGTVLDRYDGSVAAPAGAPGARTDVQVLAVDTGTFAGTAFWDDGFADAPLGDLVSALAGPATDGRLPVVATGLPPGPADLRLGSRPVPAEVVATARVLPGRRTVDPVVLVAADRLPEVPAGAGADRQSELWTDGPAGPAVEALTAAGGRLSRTVEPADVLTTADFLGVTWTFGYLSALAVLVGVVAAGGLLLHVEGRTRLGVVGHVMARRMGLSRGTHLRSLVAELVGVAAAGTALGALLAAAAVAVVYRRLDVDLLRAPTPLLEVPWAAAAATAGAALLVAGLAALYARAAADRAHPAAVLREDA
ncbi:putative ABC transport system permease protein [Geodermatophilus pulveris]|uniref:Putative ABC transport system permease protein n=1 Tax=Geodermatophilus pulveris TaxID=1564159 RepID=A0A239DCD8_9ACTN|nr:hypothetical protein [Geodermatophilus pulveris]SNS29313.1 putative ABC transport system permease protein [Geodermatophilus pulveris]